MDKIWVILLNVVQFLYEVMKVMIISCTPERFLTKKSIKDELVLITGAGSGIGRLVASKLADLGCRLVLVDVNSAGNQETLKEIHRKHGNVAKCYVCDVSDRSAVYQLAKDVERDMGTVSILINNAGIGVGGKINDMPDDKIENVIRVNLLSHFWTVKAFLPRMKETNHGHLVHVGSIASLLGIPNMVEYTASKAGVMGLTESLHLELLAEGYDGIRMTTVVMAPIKTGLLNYEDNGLVPMLKPEFAAQSIVNGLLLEREVVYVPRYMYPLLFLRPFVSRKAILPAMRVIGGDGILTKVSFRKTT